MIYARPAGYSSDEDEDDFEFSTPLPRTTYCDEINKSKNIDQCVEDQFLNYLKKGDVEQLKRVLESGFKIDQPLEGGWSALMHACSLGSSHIVAILLNAGANPNFHKELFTPLMAVCVSRFEQEDQLVLCIDILVQHNVNINATDKHKTSPLMYASRGGSKRLVQKLIDSDCNIDFQDTEGWSALFHAVSEGHVEIVKVLLEKKARLNLIDRRHRSAFDLANIKGFENIAKLVCSKKEKIKLAKDAEELLVLHREIRDPVDELLSELPTHDGKSTSGFQCDVAKLLIAMGMGQFTRQFIKNNIQLNEFLLITDERLKELGVHFSVHRQRILTSIRKFHLQQWNKSSLGLKPINKQLEVDDSVRLMCNITKHLHIMYTTVNYLRVHLSVPIKLEISQSAEAASHQLNLILGEINALHVYSIRLKKKEKIVPVDLIIRKGKTSNHRIVQVLATTFVVGLIFWKTVFHMPSKRVFAW